MTHYQRATDGLNGASKPNHKHFPASAAMISTSRKLCEPAISGITAVVSADSAVRNAAVSLCQQQTPLPAATHWPLSQLARCTTLYYVVASFDSQQTFYHWEKIGKSVDCSHLPCAILQRYHTLLSVIGANVTSRSVDNYCQAWPSLSHTRLSIVN